MDRLTRQDLLALLELVRGCYAPRDRDAFFVYLLRTLPTLIASELTGYAGGAPAGTDDSQRRGAG